MNKLPHITGLLCEAESLRKRAAENELRARSARKDPRIAHEAGESALRERRDAETCQTMAEADAKMIQQITEIQNYLSQSPHGSALRSLALRELQSAEAWLRREIGDAPDAKG